MDGLNLKLKLLSGESIEVDEGIGSVKPLTIREIINYGYTDYLMRLNIITLEIEDFIPEDDNELGLNVFDLMIHIGGEVTKELENALSLFFKDVVEVDPDLQLIVVGEEENTRMINRDNFDKVREVIKWQNGINKFGEDDPEQEDSEAVRKIKEKLKKGREAVDKAKREEEEGEMDLSDIISAVSTKSNSLNKLNVFDLTIFQLYDEFKRLDLIDQYNINIKSMLAGAKDVKLKHWSSKLDW